MTDGILISPNYPNHYDHNGDCVWVISIPVNERIALYFTDFAMESTATCAFDYIEVKHCLSHIHSPNFVLGYFERLTSVMRYLLLFIKEKVFDGISKYLGPPKTKLP